MLIRKEPRVKWYLITMARKHLFDCQRGERSCLVFARSGMFGLDKALKEFLAYSTQFPLRNKTCT